MSLSLQPFNNLACFFHGKEGKFLSKMLKERYSEFRNAIIIVNLPHTTVSCGEDTLIKKVEKQDGLIRALSQSWRSERSKQYHDKRRSQFTRSPQSQRNKQRTKYSCFVAPSNIHLEDPQRMHKLSIEVLKIAIKKVPVHAENISWRVD